MTATLYGGCCALRALLFLLPERRLRSEGQKGGWRMATAATQARAARRAGGILDRTGFAQVIDLDARRRVALERDDSDPERWLDDRATIRLLEVSTWPAPR